MLSQLSIFEDKVALKQLSMGNFNKIHGLYNLEFKDDINIIMPSTFNEYDIDNALTIDEILDPGNEINEAKELYFKNILDMFLILKGNRGFDELNDMSFFPKADSISSDKDMTVEGIFECQRLFTYDLEGIKRRKKYRGKEWFYKLRDFEGQDYKARWNTYYDVDEYTKESHKTLSSFVIYPNNLLPSISKFKYTKNLNYLTECYPNLDKGKLVEDINNIFDNYSLGYSIVGNCNNLSIRKGVFQERLSELEDELLDLIMVIALEKQLRNNIVILSPYFLSSLYDESLAAGIEILKEFKLTEQQAIVLYYNIFHLPNHFLVRDQAEYYGMNIVELTEDYKSLEDWKNTTVKQSARRLCYMQDLDFDKKVLLAKDIVRRAYKTTGAKQPAIGVSFGKDSMALFYLIHDVVTEYNYPKPIICFIDTGVEFPEHIKFAREQVEVMEEMGYRVYWQKPKTTFWKVAKDYGFPLFGKAIRPSSNPTLYEKLERLDIKYCGNTCCDKLKKEPYKELYDGLDIDLAFVGILAAESNDRRQGYYRNYLSNAEKNSLYNKYGEIYHVEGEGRYKSLPLVHFSEDDIWKYIIDNNIPTSPLYSMGYWKDNKDTGEEEFITYKRTGCWTCSMNIQHSGNNVEMLRNTHPNLWELLMIKKGLAKEIYKFKHNIPADKWEDNADFLNTQMTSYLQVKPCHLDIA